VITLEAIPLFRDLNRMELRALRTITQERKFRAGQEIFQEGATGDGVYFVREGLVEISAGQGDRRVFTRLGEGEIFGEMAIIEQRPRSATATAAADTEVYFLPRGEMLTFLQRSPGLAFALLLQVSHRLRELNQLHVRELIQSENLAIIGRFAQGIVHDLKNPLSIISLSAEMLGMAGTDEAARTRVQSRISKQVVRINDMVGDILIFTRDAKKGSEPKPTDFRSFILEIVNDLNAETELKSVRIELADDPPAVMVLFDARRVSRVFFNLVNNATDMMREGGEIFLHFRLKESEVITEIEDTGPGIAPEIAGKLFQPFATHGKTHGTGLGLSICKKVIEDHGGNIWAKSEPQRGATFCFSLPLAK
jgi:signal transduction histidine kinase